MTPTGASNPQSHEYAKGHKVAGLGTPGQREHFVGCQFRLSQRVTQELVGRPPG